jgi:hypothetical protein
MRYPPWVWRADAWIRRLDGRHPVTLYIVAGLIAAWVAYDLLR